MTPGKMVKTPVTLLQELLLKNNMVPNFELIFNGTGTHQPIFKYSVTAGRHTAVGSGKSKKEAKHDSAKNLLAILKSDDSDLKEEAKKEVAEDVQSPYAEAIKDNAIGLLQEFCSSRLMQVPIYELIRDEGLPHDKIFCIRCQVSSFYTEGQARTKKQAKQLSAQFMLEKLKGTLETLVEEYKPPPPIEIKSQIPDIIQKLEAVRPSQRPTTLLTNHVGLRINELHQSIKEFVKFKPSSTLEEMLEKELYDHQEAMRKKIEVELLGISIGQQLTLLEPVQLTIALKLISDSIFYGKMGQLSSNSYVSVSSSPDSLQSSTAEPAETASVLSGVLSIK